MITKPEFELGTVVMTASAMHAVPPHIALPCLAKHARADWGDGLCAADRKMNDEALLNGERLLSSYLIPATECHGEDKLWIITEHDRSVTTLLLPSDY